jgi:hypothetical protein
LVLKRITSICIENADSDVGLQEQCFEFFALVWGQTISFLKYFRGEQEGGGKFCGGVTVDLKIKFAKIPFSRQGLQLRTLFLGFYAMSQELGRLLLCNSHLLMAEVGAGVVGDGVMGDGVILELV